MIMRRNERAEAENLLGVRRRSTGTFLLPMTFLPTKGDDSETNLYSDYAAITMHDESLFAADYTLPKGAAKTTYTDAQG